MADHHRAAHAQRLGARANLLQAEQAHLAGFVQVDVHAHAALLRDGEDAVQLPLGVAVHLTGVDAAHHLGAGADGGVQQIEHLLAARAHHPRLGKGHHLNAGRMGMGLRGLQRAFQRAQPEGRRDVGMGADMGGAVRHALPQQRPCAARRIQRQAGQHALVILDAAHPVGLRPVRNPGQAEQRFVEMRVPLDQAGQQQLAAQIHGGAGRVGRIGGQDGRDASLTDQQAPPLRPSIRQAKVPEQQALHRPYRPGACRVCRCTLPGMVVARP